MGICSASDYFCSHGTVAACDESVICENGLFTRLVLDSDVVRVIPSEIALFCNLTHLYVSHLIARAHFSKHNHFQDTERDIAERGWPSI
jgi:hypothetical protein